MERSRSPILLLPGRNTAAGSKFRHFSQCQQELADISILFIYSFRREVLKMPKSRSAYREFPHVSRLLEEKLVRRRKEMKISQTGLANKTGLTRNCIQQMECHEHMPLPSTMFKLLKALEFSEEEAARFWVEIEEAYAKDRMLQESDTKTPETV